MRFFVFDAPQAQSRNVSRISCAPLQACRTTITLRFRKEFAHILRLICLALFPVAGLDDGRVRRNPFHDIHPAGVRDAIGERCLDELSVVESGVIFETVHAFPVLQRIFDELGKVKNSTKKRGSGAERLNRSLLRDCIFKV